MSDAIITDSASRPFAAPRKKTGGYAAFVAAGILLSRISGLVRVSIFSHYLGNSDPAGAFGAAVRIPNFMQNLFGEGVLSASFIPVYSRLIAEGEVELAGRVASVVATILAAGVSVIVLAGVLLTPVLVDLVAPGFHGDLRALTVSLVQILFPGVGLLVLSAWCLGILNSHRKFFLSYVAPVFWNLAMIITLVVFGARLTHRSLSVALAWGSVAGSFLQLGAQLPFALRYGGAFRFAFDTALEPAREVFRNLGPILLSRGVVQLSAYIDGMIASFLGASAVASLAYAQTLYLLPIALFGMSVAAAELPEMSSSLGELEQIYARLRQRLQSGRRNISFFVIPSVVGFLFLGRSIVAAIYQTGIFSPQDTLYVWYILMGSTVGLLAATWGRLYSSAFYALRDTKTPLYFAVIRVSLTAALGVLFAFPLRPLLIAALTRALGLQLPALSNIELGLGAVGLTASAGVAGWIEFLLLQWALSRRIGRAGIAAHYLLRVWIAAIMAAAGALAYDRFALPALNGFLKPRYVHYDFRALTVVAVYGVMYFAASYLLRIEEVDRLAKRLGLRSR